MASVAVFSTPSPASPTELHTPPAPKHGYSDHWEPYSPRKSARIARQRQAHRTPSPGSKSRVLSNDSHYAHPTSLTTTSDLFAATLHTPATSPRKRVKRSDNHQHFDNINMTNTSIIANDKMEAQGGRKSVRSTAAQLPTPSKTPAKRATANSSVSYQHVARDILDGADQLTPSRKKRRVTALGDGTLGTFVEEEANASFEIHTDLSERVLGPDTTREKVFSSPATRAQAPALPPTTSRAKKVMISGEGWVPISEAVQRTDGMVAMFRGKRVWRKFSSQNDDEVSVSRATTPTRTTQTARADSARKVLFPPPVADENDEEEAETEIEDADEPDFEPQTPAAPIKQLATPKAPRFGPMSPPSTERVTRHRGVPTQKPRVSNPMASWGRTKSTDAVLQDAEK